MKLKARPTNQPILTTTTHPNEEGDILAMILHAVDSCMVQLQHNHDHNHNPIQITSSTTSTCNGGDGLRFSPNYSQTVSSEVGDISDRQTFRDILLSFLPLDYDGQLSTDPLPSPVITLYEHRLPPSVHSVHSAAGPNASPTRTTITTTPEEKNTWHAWTCVSRSNSLSR